MFDKTIAEVLGVSEEEIDVFTKGFSLGLLMGSCLQKSLMLNVRGKEETDEDVVRTEEGMEKMVESLILEKKGLYIIGYPDGLSRQQCDALLQVTLSNQNEFLNNIAC